VVGIMEDAWLVWASDWDCWLACDLELWVNCRAIGFGLVSYSRNFFDIELSKVGLQTLCSQS